MGRQLHIPSAKCLRVESNFHEQNKFFGEQFQVKYFKYRIMHQSIPAVPIPTPPGQPRGICSRCQSWGWGSRNFIVALGAGH